MSPSTAKTPTGLRDLLRGPTDADPRPWFRDIAEALLLDSEVEIAGERHRFVEVEVYYHRADHPDPFAHRDPLQKTCGGWYLHRRGGTLKNGSWKGLDLTFGPGDAFGGVLIRSLVDGSGRLVHGPSLCVDHAIERLRLPGVAALDAALGDRVAWSRQTPLQLRPRRRRRAAAVAATARVGLSLRGLATAPDKGRFLLRRYRFVTDPTLTKGKVQTALALLDDGLSVEDVAAEIRSSKATVERWLATRDDGRRAGRLEDFASRPLGSLELCRVAGILGSPTSPSAASGPRHLRERRPV